MVSPNVGENVPLGDGPDRFSPKIGKKNYHLKVGQIGRSETSITN